MSSLRPASRWTVAVWVGAAVYTVLLSAESIYRHRGYQTSFDLAVYDQLLWLLSTGHEPFSSLVSRPMLGDHFTPGLVLLTPVYWVGLDLSGLLILQSAALGLTAPALFTLGRDAGASPAVAALPAFLWLLSPWVASVNLFEFHPTAFAPALITVSVIAARRDSWGLLAGTALLALSLREDVAVTYVVMGVVLLLTGRRRIGLAVALGSAAWLLLAGRIIGSQGDSLEFFGRRFAGDRGDSMGDALVWVLTHPLEALTDAVANSGADIVLLLASTGGLALLAPVWMLLAVPTLLHNALTANAFQHDLLRHYHLLAAAGLFIAAAIGVRRVPKIRGARVVALVAAPAVAVALVGGLVIHDVWIGGQFFDRRSVRTALDRVPPDAAVATTIHLLPHVSQREEVYALPEPFIPWDWGSPLPRSELRERAERVRFVALYAGDGPLPYALNAVPILRRSGFVEIYRDERITLFERASTD